MPGTPPLARLRQFDTVRLIPSRFADREQSVLTALAENADHLRDLFDLDNATNERLLGESGGLAGIGIDELVFGVPNFRIINAAFTYPRPEGSRFNDGDRGAWYCAFELATAMAEIIFHRTVEYEEIDRFDDSVSYQALLADFSSEFHDLRGASSSPTSPRSFSACLDPGSYLASQRLAAELLEAGSMGIIYPSVRRPGGTNLACFRPALVGHLRRGAAFRLTWSGSPQPLVEPIPEAA
ncbi:RES family NAD+ phosphorylase [Accumulibacter sp.]|uniref:RES family NAD+ phosphorylase n=1 Tax=Accumulibacter sp. TaxID=2053492 RepID=UPI00261312EB|nr:RES family NAD+ phosphorylase [Accumulibacter sp.]